jgi:DNA polymerase-3 subunit gamma/tau
MTITGGDPSPAPTVPAEPASVKPAPHVVEPTVIEPARPAPREPETAAPPVAEGAEPAPSPEPVAPPAPPTTTKAGSTLTLVDVRRLWPDIVEATKQRRRLTWIYLTQQAKVVAVDDQALTLGFANAGARDSFDSGGSAEIVRQAAIDVVGHDWRVDTIVDPGAEPDAASQPAAASAPPARPAGDQLGSPTTTEPGTSEAPDWVRAEPEAVTEATPVGRPSTQAREAIAPTRVRGAGEADPPAEPVDPDGGARHDDTDAESSGLDGAQLLQEALGAQVIDEIPHQ